MLSTPTMRATHRVTGQLLDSAPVHNRIAEGRLIAPLLSFRCPLIPRCLFCARDQCASTLVSTPNSLFLVVPLERIPHNSTILVLFLVLSFLRFTILERFFLSIWTLKESIPCGLSSIEGPLPSLLLPIMADNRLVRRYRERTPLR